MANKQDSSCTTLYIAEELTPKVLPGTLGADAIWRAAEPNTYSDFGGKYSKVSRNPINAGRQVKKGVLTDLEVSGGFNTDITHNNNQRYMQGFLFADAHEKPDTISFNSTAIPITSVTASTKTYAAASGLGIFKANHLIWTSGFSNAANNGLDLVASATGTTVVGTATKADEASPAATARIEAVGFQFPSGDLTLTVSASGIRLTSASFIMTGLGLTVGEWIFVGGDASANKFANNPPGYARIKAITSTYIDLNETTFTPTDDSGTGKLIRLFFGRFIKNEATCDLIKRRSYQLQRQLGEDSNGTMSEYLLGSFPNEFKLNVPESNKLNADLSFVCMDYETRTGTEEVKAGTYISSLDEDAYNTSNDVFRMKMSLYDSANINNPALFAYVTDANIAITNNVTPNKAIGTLGAFDASTGDFVVSGSLTAYFATVDAVAAIRNNSDVSFNAIFARENNGFVIDLPLITLGGGLLNVEKDQPITLPVDMSACENDLGFTMGVTFFTYLPTVAMPE